MKRATIHAFFKHIIIFIVVVIGINSVYYFWSIYAARQYTTRVVTKDLQKAQWRSLHGTVNSFEIHAADLSKAQKEILIKVQDPGFYSHGGIDLSTPGAGLTTITQAIVKKLYFENFKAGIAKIRQSLIARFVVHDLISKTTN